VRVGDRAFDCGQLGSTTWKSNSGRTSTPPATIGVSLASASAWSRSRASSREDAGDRFLALDERPVGHHICADRGRGAGRLEGQPGRDPAALLGDPIGSAMCAAITSGGMSAAPPGVSCSYMNTAY